MLLEKQVHLQKEVGAAGVSMNVRGLRVEAHLLDARANDVNERNVKRRSSSLQLGELELENADILGVVGVGDSMVLGRL